MGSRRTGGGHVRLRTMAFLGFARRDHRSDVTGESGESIRRRTGRNDRDGRRSSNPSRSLIDIVDAGVESSPSEKLASHRAVACVRCRINRDDLTTIRVIHLSTDGDVTCVTSTCVPRFLDTTPSTPLPRHHSQDVASSTIPPRTAHATNQVRARGVERGERKSTSWETMTVSTASSGDPGRVSADH